MHPASIRRTPFDCYRTQAPPAPTENPYRFIHKKLGLSEAAFEARLKEDVEALLKEIDDDKLTQEVHTPPPPRRDMCCLRMSVSKCFAGKNFQLAHSLVIISGRPISTGLASTSTSPGMRRDSAFLMHMTFDLPSCFLGWVSLVGSLVGLYWRPHCSRCSGVSSRAPLG